MNADDLTPLQQAQLNVNQLRIKATIEGMQEAHRLFEEEVRGKKGTTEAQAMTLQQRYLHRMEDMKGHWLREMRQLHFKLEGAQKEVASLRKQLEKAKAKGAL